MPNSEGENEIQYEGGIVTLLLDRETFHQDCPITIMERDVKIESIGGGGDRTPLCKTVK